MLFVKSQDILSAQLASKADEIEEYKQKDTFYELARNVRAYGPEKGAQIFIDMIQQKAKDTKPRAFSRLDGKSLKDVVTSHIKREYSSLAGREQ